jgi:hypothetical protein
LHLYRAMLSALVAVAVILAPMAAEWAARGAKGMGVAMAHTISHVVEGEDSAAASPKEDCASMMKGAASADECPCCDKDKTCPPQFCIAKCFQFLGLAHQSQPIVDLATALLRPSTAAHPPDRSDQPQPPPPRT